MNVAVEIHHRKSHQMCDTTIAHAMAVFDQMLQTIEARPHWCQMQKVFIEYFLIKWSSFEQIIG